MISDGITILREPPGYAPSWFEITTLTPQENQLCVVCARSADPKSPFRHVSHWTSLDGFFGLVPTWNKAISHWMPFPKTPFNEGKI